MHKKVPAEKASAAPRIGRSGLMECSPNRNTITPSGTASAKSRFATCARRRATDRHQRAERQRIERDMQPDHQKDRQPGEKMVAPFEIRLGGDASGQRHAIGGAVQSQARQRRLPSAQTRDAVRMTVVVPRGHVRDRGLSHRPIN